MNDFYTEQLVKKQPDMKDLAIKVGLAALFIISVLIVFMFPIGLILPVIVIVFDVFMFRRLNVEYEYLYVNGDLDIDKIMNRSKRKKMFAMNVSDLELLAPADSPEMKRYQNLKTSNYCSGMGQAREYALIIANHGELKKIIFEPNDTILEGFYILAPRKVIRK